MGEDLETYTIHPVTSLLRLPSIYLFRPHYAPLWKCIHITVDIMDLQLLGVVCLEPYWIIVLADAETMTALGFSCLRWPALFWMSIC